MNSPFSKLYLAIVERLTAKVPALKYIEQDFGQLQGYSNRPAVAFPCALVDFSKFNFDEIGNYHQIADGIVSINLGFALYSASSNITPLEFRKEPLMHYEIEWCIHKALHGWSPGDEFGKLTRVSVHSVNTPMAVRVRPISFKLSFEDYSVDMGYDTANVDELELSTTIVDSHFVNP